MTLKEVKEAYANICEDMSTNDPMKYDFAAAIRSLEILDSKPVAWMNTKYKTVHLYCAGDDAEPLELSAAYEAGELIPLYAISESEEIGRLIKKYRLWLLLVMV